MLIEKWLLERPVSPRFESARFRSTEPSADSVFRAAISTENSEEPFFGALLEISIEETNLHNNEKSFWNEIPSSSVWNTQRLSVAPKEWLELYPTHFKRYFSEAYAFKDIDSNRVEELDLLTASMIQANMHDWNGMSYSDRVKEAKALRKKQEASGFSSLTDFLGAYPPRLANTDAAVVDEVLKKKSPTRKKLLDALRERLKKFEFDGAYYDDAKLLEGNISSLGYDFSLQIFLESKFGFSYSLGLVSESLRMIRIADNYEGLMYLGVGDWDLIDSENLDESLDVFTETLTRFLWLNSSSLKECGARN